MSKVQLAGNASGTGIFTIASPNSNTDRTLTLPDNTGTIITTASTGGVSQAMLAAGVAGNGPAFSAYKSGSVTISHNVATKVTFDTEMFDTNSNFASSTFTPTVAGYYQPTGLIYYNGTAGRQYVLVTQLYKNGSVYSRNAISLSMGTGGDFCVPVASTLVSMNGSTDYIELYAYSYDYTTGQSVTLIGGAGYTTFGAFLARSA